MTERVYHTRYGLELDLSLDDLGHPGRPGLWEEIYRPRPFEPELLRCVGLGRDGAECREAMYVTIRHGRRIACHLNPAAGPHAPDEGSRREALKERIAVSAQRAGFDAVVDGGGGLGGVGGLGVGGDGGVGGGGRQTGVLVKGRGGRAIGWEVQFRRISGGSVRRRSRRAHQRGVTPMWTIDDRRSEVVDRAPWTRLDRVTDWRQFARRHLNVRGGVRELRMERCDERRATPCPDRGWGRCGGWHACWDPALGVYLDDLIARTASGDYVPLFLPTKTRRGGNHMWVTTKDKADFLQDRPEPYPWDVEDDDHYEEDDFGDDGRQGGFTSGQLDYDQGTGHNHVDRIDAAAWLTTSAEAGPGRIDVADRYHPPQDLVDLRKAFVRADEQYSEIVREMPSGLAIARGTASIPAELKARSNLVYTERAGIVEQLHRHPWWSTVDNRYAAERELWKVARDQVV